MTAPSAADAPARLTGPGGADPRTDERMVVVLVAHDDRKPDLVEWARFNRDTLAGCTLYATRTTGQAVVEADIVICLWDPLTPQPHDVDVKALLRLAVLHDVPIACNRSTADFLISSPLVRECRRYRERRRDLAARPAAQR
jgi:methylglyoxal synthase